jgi:hypothetical protein
VFLRAQPQHHDDKIKRVKRVEVPGELKKKSCWCFCQEKKIGQQWYEVQRYPRLPEGTIGIRGSEMNKAW